MATPRVLTCTLAALVLPMFACEIETPATDAYSYEGSSTTAPASYALRTPPAQAAPPATLASTGAASAPARRRHPGDDPFADASRALRPFVAGGETRFLCPSRYRPVAAEGGCACVSSRDGLTEYPLGDAPCGDGVARAEGNECIFRCPAPEP